MKFGNWTITEQGIEWSGDSLNRFIINPGQLLETVVIEEGMPEMYQWIVLATEEDWLTEDDLYDFNHAFIYAVASTNQPFSYEIFDRTLSYQYELLDEEHEQQPASIFGMQLEK
ncbi:MAG TPA: hypothetical protein VLC28_13910 [Flavitalea sp.]|nr:hypothetical protein [Flavitalea sp.]